MNEIELEFTTNILKPWDDLNQLLSERLVLEPKISELTRLSKDLAKNMHHHTDYFIKKNGGNDTDVKKERKAIHMASDENKIIGDVADTSKHFDLRDTNRIALIQLSSLFEYKTDKFRFIRNLSNINYQNTADTFCFLKTSYEAIHYLLNHFNMNMTFERSIIENGDDFFNEAWLYHDSKNSISLKSSNIEFLEKNNEGHYIHVNPKEVRFAVYNKHEDNTK